MFHILILLLLGLTTSAQPGGKLASGIESFKAGRFTQAKTIFEEILRADPEDDQALFYLGRLDLVEDDYSSAVQHFEEALKVNPENSDYHLWLGRALGERLTYVGMFKKIKLSMKMKKEFEKAVELDSTSIPAHFQMFYLYLHSPAMAGGGVEKAKKEAEVIQGLDEVEGHLALAAIYDKAGEREKAREEYRAALGLKPGGIEVMYNYGIFLQGHKEYDEAVQYFLKILELDPQNYNAHYQIGKTHILAEKGLTEAKYHLQKCLTLKSADHPSPSRAAVHWRLGQAYYLLDQPQRARQEWEESLRLEPNFKEPKESLKNLAPGGR